MTGEVQNATGAQKRVPYADMGIQGSLPGGSQMLTFKSSHDDSKYHVKVGCWEESKAGR